MNGSPDIAGTGGADGAGAAQPTAAPGPVRVLINHAAGTKNALPAMQLATHLRERGFVVDNIRAVESEVERPSVRYFFEGDQPDSHRLVEAVGAFLSQAPVRAPTEAEDFSHASPRAQRGRMEVWLPTMAAAAGRHPSRARRV